MTAEITTMQHLSRHTRCLRTLFVRVDVPNRYLQTSPRCLQDLQTSPGVETYQGDLPVSPALQYPSLPVMTSRKLPFLPANYPSKQAWLETLSQTEDQKLGIVDLHPRIFGVPPRIDVLWWNIFWQRQYKHVNFDKLKTRAELRGGGRKPWQQKGTGKARHGSIRSPLWKGGGKSFGPRGPKSYFFMPPKSLRVLGLATALTVKYAQDNLHIVDSLELPSDEHEYLEGVIEERGWGLSVLFIDDTDVISRNIALAADQIKQYNVMPVYGLNVYSMLKHETLVITLPALELIEEKLLTEMNSQDYINRKFKKSDANSF